jgi:hypothetical protein
LLENDEILSSPIPRTLDHRLCQEPIGVQDGRATIDRSRG